MSVRDATYFGIALIRSANGSPARWGHAAAIACHVRRPNSSAVGAVDHLVDHRAHRVGVEVRHRPPAVAEAAVGVLPFAAGRLDHTVEADEIDDDDAHEG